MDDCKMKLHDRLLEYENMHDESSILAYSMWMSGYITCLRENGLISDRDFIDFLRENDKQKEITLNVNM